MRINYAIFCYDAGDKRGGNDIKRRIEGLCTLCCYALSVEKKDLVSGTKTLIEHPLI